MPTFTLRGRVTPDHRLEVQLPPEVPVGEAEVTLSVKPEEIPPLGSPARFLQGLAEIHRRYPGSGRTKEEVDRYLAGERASWDDDS